MCLVGDARHHRLDEKRRPFGADVREHRVFVVGHKALHCSPHRIEHTGDDLVPLTKDCRVDRPWTHCLGRPFVRRRRAGVRTRARGRLGHEILFRVSRHALRARRTQPLENLVHATLRGWRLRRLGLCLDSLEHRVLGRFVDWCAIVGRRRVESSFSVEDTHHRRDAFFTVCGGLGWRRRRRSLRVGWSRRLVPRLTIARHDHDFACRDL